MKVEFNQSFSQPFVTDEAIMNPALLELAEYIVACITPDNRDLMSIGKKQVYDQFTHNNTIEAAQMVMATQNGGTFRRVHGCGEVVAIVTKEGFITNGWHGAVCRRDIENMERMRDKHLYAMEKINNSLSA